MQESDPHELKVPCSSYATRTRWCCHVPGCGEARKNSLLTSPCPISPLLFAFSSNFAFRRVKRDRKLKGQRYSCCLVHKCMSVSVHRSSKINAMQTQGSVSTWIAEVMQRQRGCDINTGRKFTSLIFGSMHSFTCCLGLCLWLWRI